MKIKQTSVLEQKLLIVFGTREEKAKYEQITFSSQVSKVTLGFHGELAMKY